jgi:hypothetical protein
MGSVVSMLIRAMLSPQIALPIHKISEFTKSSRRMMLQVHQPSTYSAFTGCKSKSIIATNFKSKITTQITGQQGHITYPTLRVFKYTKLNQLSVSLAN